MIQMSNLRIKLIIILIILSLSTVWAQQFTIIRNKGLNSVYSQKNLLISVKINDIIHCMGECLKNKLCNLIVINNSMICNVYLNIPLSSGIMIDAIGTNIYVFDNSKYTSSLIYSWPFNSYNGLNDLVNGVTLTAGGTFSYTTDRFNNPSSALYLHYGWLDGPYQIYLSSSFTLSFWIRIRENMCSIIFTATHLTFNH